MSVNDQLTHFNEQSRARMVDVSAKDITERVAVAKSQVKMKPETLERIKLGQIGKGDVLAVAQVAGIMAAKKTWEMIPMCHPLFLTGIDIRFEYAGDDKIALEATVKTTGKTGVEMEALTAVNAAALTIYDMCKAMDKEMIIGPTYLQSKTGGKSGEFVRTMDEG
ncbi:cyclic pyranopterin monophosphate synthase MoaC [Brevibacillus ginsengisoli]|uniref:cyclic pyranopterin monophosphate synthase MoaC n=1 Tax=Brevibacillus ginsengisoli TaxID=363854 RepID=UPI003CE9EFA4